MTKLDFSLLLMIITASSISPCDSKVAEDDPLAAPHIDYEPTYAGRNLEAETLSIKLSNQDYISATFILHPDPGQNPYSGLYTVHDSICLYQLEEYQAEQYYHYLKNMLAQKTIAHATGSTPLTQFTVKRKTKKRKQMPLESFRMALRSSTKKQQQ